MSTLKANKWTNTLGDVYQTVLQVKSTTYDGSYAFSGFGGNYYRSPLSVTISPYGDNSTFFVVADCQGYCSTGASNGHNVGIWAWVGNTGEPDSNNLVGGKAQDTYAQSCSAGADQQDTWMGLYHGYTPATATSWSRNRTTLWSPSLSKGTPLTFTVVLGGWTGSSTINLGWTNYTPSNKITVFEFAK